MCLWFQIDVGLLTWRHAVFFRSWNQGCSSVTQDAQFSLCASRIVSSIHELQLELYFKPSAFPRQRHANG